MRNETKCRDRLIMLTTDKNVFGQSIIITNTLKAVREPVLLLLIGLVIDKVTDYLDLSINLTSTFYYFVVFVFQIQECKILKKVSD